MLIKMPQKRALRRHYPKKGEKKEGELAVPARATQPSLHPYCVQRISCDLMRYPPTNLGVAVPAHRSPAVVDWYVTRAIPLSPMLRTALVRCRFRRSADMPKRTACPFLVVVLHAVCHAYVCNRGTLWPCCARRAEPPARTGPFICAAVVCRCCSDQVHSTGRPEGYIFCACVFIAVPAVHCVERTTIAISSCLLQHSVHTLLASFVAGAVLWLRRHCGQRQQTGTPYVGQRTDRNLHTARGLNDFVKYTYGRRFFCARQQLRTPAGADATAAAHDQSSRTHADRARVCATDAQPGRGRRQSRTSSLWRVGYFRHTHTLWSSRSAVSSSFRGVS